MAKFPKTLYVTHQNDGGDDDYLNTSEDVPDVDENTPLGIYELCEIAEIIVTREVKQQGIRRASDDK